MSATEQMRAMLDGLMGTARDGNESKGKHLHFTDPRVCRAFLLDCCPHDIFASTKLELGECSKVHDHALRADYISANKIEDYMYENSALDRLQLFVSDADRKTDLLRRKLAETQEELTAEETSKLNRVHDLTETLGKKLAQVDKADADGDLELKEKLMDEADKIKRERATAEAEYRQVSRPAASHQQQNLRVCDICSAYLGINDNDSRLADHFGGRLHLGFITVREKLDDLKKIVAEKRNLKRNSNAADKSSSSSMNHHIRDRSTNRDRSVHRDRSVNRERSSNRDRDRDRDYDYDRSSRGGYEPRYDRDYDHHSRQSRSRDYDRGYYQRDRDYDRDYERDYDRYRARDRVHDRPRSRGAFERIDGYQERDIIYQRRLREWEKRETEKARRYAKRISEERDKKQLEEQESKKLKEFLEDYKDDRDDIRFYRGSALARRLAARRKEMEEDELSRQKEKMELEILSRSCVANENTSPGEPVEDAMSPNETTATTSDNVAATDNQNNNTTNTANSNGIANNDMGSSGLVDNNGVKQSSTSSNNNQKEKGTSSESKRKHFEELIGRIPTDKEQLFSRELDWSLLDDTLMEKRIRPWVTKKIAEYMGEKEVELIDFVCAQLNEHLDGNSMLREVAVVLDDEAEKFVVHLWRLLIFELEAKKSGLRK